jgi:hypothetical protein
MLLVYAPKITPRLHYIFDFVFNDVLGTEFKVTTDKDEFQGSDLPKLNYSTTPFVNEVFVPAVNLIFEKGIREQDLSFNIWNDMPVLFYLHPRFEFPFDLFSASFYLITRYEEYLPHLRDTYDRYNPSASIAVKKRFVHKPVVDQWILQFKKYLQKNFPELTFKERKYNYISTIDIDNAYAYREKGFLRSAAAYTRSLLQFKFNDFSDRLRSQLGWMHDPYDTYALLLEIQKKYKIKMIYFFLLGDYDLNDKNVSYDSQRYRSLIQYLSDVAQIGIHPSFASNAEPQKLHTEILRLSKTSKREVKNSRQHFLKLQFPQTYRKLLENDITDDYSMGFAQTTGFRAGTCTAFRFYDLDREEVTKLKVHPFAVMDATLRYYLNISPQESIPHIQSLINEVKAVNGTFISLWHNESLSDYKQWKGWRNVYEETVRLAVS